MRSVAIVTTRSADGTVGGAEHLYEGLIEAFRREGWAADEVPIVFDETTFESILDGYRAAGRLNLLAYDLVVSTKAPTYGVWHPNHACWLVHTIRVFYDRFAEGVESPPNWLLNQQKRIHEMDNRLLSRPGVRRFSIGRTVSRRLENFLGLDARVIHPPVHQQDFRSAEPKRSVEPKPYLLSVGRLHRWKRVDLVIRAFKQMRSDCELWIVGEGDQYGDLLHLASSTPGIRFLGRVSKKELLDLYAKATVVAFTPVEEDYGYVTIEAFLSGKPVVTLTDSGEAAEIVRESNGGLVSDPVVGSLARALDRLVDAPSLARQLAENGKKWASQLNWSNVLKALADGG